MSTSSKSARPTTEGIGSFTSTFNTDPWEFYEQVRARGDVVWDEEAEIWLLTSYKAVKELAMQDLERWSDPFLTFDPEAPQFGLERMDWVNYTGGPTVMQQVDAETHNRQHRWWMHALSPKVLKQWGELLLDPLITSTLEPFLDSGRVELGEQFMQPLAPRMMAAVLGLPIDEDWLQEYSRTGRRMLALFAPDPDIPACLEAGREVNAMIMEHVMAKRPDGTTESSEILGRDFIRLLWDGGDELFGPDFGPNDVRGHAMQAVLASFESIGGAARNGLYLLATHPEMQEQVRSDDRAAQNFVEESLRLFGSVEFRPRRAMEETTILGTEIGRREIAYALMACANRDPEVYPHPYDVDLARKAPRDHFAFFQGPKICAGQSLARFTLQRVFQRVLDNVSNLRLDPDAPPPAYNGSLDRRWGPLNVCFDALPTRP